MLTLFRGLIVNIAAPGPRRPVRRFPSATTTAPPAPPTTCPRLVIGLVPRRGAGRKVFAPFDLFFGRHEIVDKIGRYHFVRQQLFGRRLGVPLSLASLFGVLATRLGAPFMAAAATSAPIASAASIIPVASAALFARRIAAACRTRRCFGAIAAERFVLCRSRRR